MMSHNNRGNRLNISFPMLFKIQNEKKQRTSHTGVLEFIADEGRVYLPGWMMRNLLLDEGKLLTTYFIIT